MYQRRVRPFAPVTPLPTSLRAEENSVQRVADAMESGGRSDGMRAECSEEEEEVLVSIGTTILTMRSCNPKTCCCARDSGRDGVGDGSTVGGDFNARSPSSSQQDPEMFSTVYEEVRDKDLLHAGLFLLITFMCCKWACKKGQSYTHAHPCNKCHILWIDGIEGNGGSVIGEVESACLPVCQSASM